MPYYHPLELEDTLAEESSTTTVTVTARQIEILIAGICALEDRGSGYDQSEINEIRATLFRELPRSN
jgi:hypothetical protein